MKVVRWCRTQVSCHNSQGVVDGKVNEAGVGTRGGHGEDQDWTSCRILAIFSDQDWIWIFIFEKNWIRTASGYLLNFYNEISLKVIKFQDVTNGGVSTFFATVLIFTKKSKLFCFAGTHRYACSHSSPHALCAAVACFRLMRTFGKFFVLSTLHSFATAHFRRVSTDYSY